MLFNSIDFAIFLPIVFFLFWFHSNNIKWQNIIIFVSNYIFYGWWDWKFLSLIFLSTLIDYFVGIKIFESDNQTIRKRFLYLSIFSNLGILCFFKYYNFFIENFITAFSLFGLKPSIYTLNIILPAGISFYTFQTLSYSIDVYKNKLTPCKDIIVFSSFVSFFPQLVAGPIERASNLLPQFSIKKTFDIENASSGLKQILWGLFKKVVIADNCAFYVNTIFGDYENLNGSTLFIGAIFFTFQIYGDFSGYSDIAIGTAKLFGFDLMKNFYYPYFSRDIAEFWRRWHISLSTWFRDYLYIPLGGSRGNLSSKIRNTFIVFIVSGFWHGANWTFIFWGILHSLYFLPLLLSKKNRNNIDIVAQGKIIPNIKDIFNITFTFILVVIGWIFFRSETLSDSFRYIQIIFSKSLFEVPTVRPTILFVILFVFIFLEWIGREKNFPLESFFSNNRYARWFTYYILVILIFVFSKSNQQFIYFQF